MKNKVLAITGGTGFVGRALIAQALARGHRVRALTRSSQVEQAGVEWVAGALDRPDSLLNLCRGSDAVIHAAGAVKAADKAGFEAPNVTGTMAVVEAARQAGVRRFVHVSSLSAREPELSDYGWSKARGEKLVQASGLDWTIVRPPWVYGPGDADTLDLFRMAKRGMVVLPPEGIVSLIEVGDLSRLLLALLPAEDAQAHLFEADDGRAGGWRHSEVGEAIGDAVGRKVTTVSIPPALLKIGAALDRLFRGRKARLTGDRVRYFCHRNWAVEPDRRPPSHIWLPQVETREGLGATARAYVEAGWLRP